MNGNPRLTRMFIAAMAVLAIATTIYAALSSHTLHLPLALAVLVLAAATSRMKVKLPGIDGTMSVNLPFLLTAIINLSTAEAILITCVSTATQCWPRKEAKFNPQQFVFNISMMAFASCVAGLAFRAEWLRNLVGNSATLGLAVATAITFFGQTVPVAGIVAVTERRPARQIWQNLAQLSFPYYVLSAGISSMVQTVSSHVGWQMALAVFPVMYGIYRSYTLYFANATEIPRTQPMVRAAGAGA
jgi:hypothetical protein